MDPMTIGALAGLGKSFLIDAPKADRDRKLAATTAALSPWTGMQPTMPQEANPFGSALQGGMAGAMFQQANPGLGKEFGADQGLVDQATKGMGQQMPNQLDNGQSMAMKPKTFMSPYDRMQLG